MKGAAAQAASTSENKEQRGDGDVTEGGDAADTENGASSKNAPLLQHHNGRGRKKAIGGASAQLERGV